jgi:hypothetical protein
MKNNAPRQSPDLDGAGPAFNDQELLSRRIKVLEQRLLMLRGDHRMLGSSQYRERSAARKPSRRLAGAEGES